MDDDNFVKDFLDKHKDRVEGFVLTLIETLVNQDDHSVEESMLLMQLIFQIFVEKHFAILVLVHEDPKQAVKDVAGIYNGCVKHLRDHFIEAAPRLIKAHKEFEEAQHGR